MVLLQHKLSVKLSQRQILTPGLVQMVSVLALNKLELKDMINTEMVENPVLEELEDSVPLLDEVGKKEEDRERAAAATTEENPIAAVEKKDPFEEIDFGSFFDEFLGPIVRNVQTFTKPLQPIIDTAESPIPGLSQLSELAGQVPITFLDFFEHASGADLTMLHRIIDLIDLVNNLPSSGSLIDLGHFSLDSNAAEGPAPTGDNADKLIDTGDESNPADALTSGTVSNAAAVKTSVTLIRATTRSAGRNNSRPPMTMPAMTPINLASVSMPFQLAHCSTAVGAISGSAASTGRTARS